MLKEINEKINIIKEDQALKSVLEGKIENLEVQLKTEERILEELKISLKKEHKDVKRLEKEQHEYLMTKIKYDDQSSKVALLKENIASIQSRLWDLGKCEKEYRELLNKKLEIIKAKGNHNESIKLSQLEMEIDEALRAQKEIEEAENVGRELIEIIEAAEDSLSSAKNWGIMDIAEGDLVSSMVKQCRRNIK